MDDICSGRFSKFTIPPKVPWTDRGRNRHSFLELETNRRPVDLSTGWRFHVGFLRSWPTFFGVMKTWPLGKPVFFGDLPKNREVKRSRLKNHLDIETVFCFSILYKWKSWIFVVVFTVFWGQHLYIKKTYIIRDIYIKIHGYLNQLVTRWIMVWCLYKQNLALSSNHFINSWNPFHQLMGDTHGSLI